MGLDEKIQPIIMVILTIILLLGMFGGMASIIISSADNAQYPNAVDSCDSQGLYWNITHSTVNCTIAEDNSTLSGYPNIKALPLASTMGRSGFLLIILVIVFILIIYGVIKKMKG